MLVFPTFLLPGTWQILESESRGWKRNTGTGEKWQKICATQHFFFIYMRAIPSSTIFRSPPDIGEGAAKGCSIFFLVGRASATCRGSEKDIHRQPLHISKQRGERTVTYDARAARDRARFFSRHRLHLPLVCGRRIADYDHDAIQRW